jgi:hypothetical protein
MTKDLEFIQHLSAKFSHELSGVLGAIHNGVELLEESDGEIRDHAMSLISLSSKQAVGRLLFYRQTYGIAKSDSDTSLENFNDIIIKYFYGTKMFFSFAKDNPKLLFCQTAVKIFLSMLVIASGNLLIGGEIVTHTSESDTHKKIEIITTGNKIKIDDEKNKILTMNDDANNITINNIHALYIKKLKQIINAEIKIENRPNSATYIIYIPI